MVATTHNNTYSYCITNNNGIGLAGIGTSANSLTFTFPIGYKYLAITTGNTSSYNASTQITINITNIQLELGETKTNYEEHKETLANVNLPVENKLKIKNTIDRGLTTRVNEDGSINVSGTATETIAYIDTGETMPLQAGTYTLSIEQPLSVEIRIFFYNGSQIGTATLNAGSTSSNATLPTNATNYGVILFGLTANTTYNLTFKPQLEKGTKANSFTPFGTTPIEYCEIGNYADIFFKNVISSPLYNATLELDKWYLKKNIGKYVANNDLTGNGSSDTRVDLRTPALNITARLTTDILAQSSKNNLLPSRPTGSIGQGLAGTTSESEIRVQLSKEYCSDYATANTFLTNNNFTIYYPLANPEYLPLNDTLQEQLEYIYNQMLAYKGQTNISQINNDLPFIIDSTALKDLTSL